MTALAVISALMTALWIGYHFGRRAGTTPPTWKQRTSRMALGKRAIGLVVLITARRIQRGLPVQRALPAAVGIWGLKRAEPLLFRNSSPRRRFR